MVNEYNRNDALRRLQRGIALERANRVKEAVSEYHQALLAYPHLREAHEALGMYYQRCGKLALAAESFRNATNLDGDLHSFFNLGYVLLRLERLDEASEAFQRCLELSPGQPAALYELSWIAYIKGDYQHALTTLAIPLRSFANDWELHLLRGNCYMGLQQFDDALAAFRKAQFLTEDVSAQTTLLGRIAAVERHREFCALGTTNDQLYAEGGVIYLGSSQDDGLQIAEMAHFHFTYPDIGTTLQRFIALYQSCRWHFTAIVALDKSGAPLARAIAQLTGVPLRAPRDLRANDAALLVLAVAREAELLQLTLERIPCKHLTFCLGLNWLRHSTLLPEVIGIVAHNSCSLPWEAELRRLRSNGAPLSTVETCIQQASAEIITAVQNTPIDINLPRQMRYYMRTHRRLNLPANAASIPSASQA